MREALIERHLVKLFKHIGEAFKFVSPANRAVPDRLCLRHVPEAHREIVARYVRFVEVKATGETPTPLQLHKHEQLRVMGYRVEVIDTKEGVERFVEGMAS